MAWPSHSWTLAMSTWWSSALVMSGPISRPTRAREAETIAPAHSSRTAATGQDYGSAGRPPHIFGVPGPPAPILAPVSLMSEKSKRNLVKPRSRPFRSGWSPPSAGLSGSQGFSRAAIRACRRLRPEVGREGDHGVARSGRVRASLASVPRSALADAFGPRWQNRRKNLQAERFSSTQARVTFGDSTYCSAHTEFFSVLLSVQNPGLHQPRLI